MGDEGQQNERLAGRNRRRRGEKRAPREAGARPHRFGGLEAACAALAAPSPGSAPGPPEALSAGRRLPWQFCLGPPPAAALRGRHERAQPHVHLGLVVPAQVLVPDASRRPRACASRAAARRSGVSSGPASISRIQSRSTSGSAASNTRCSAACPPERARSSGSCPSGSRAKRSDLPGSSSGQRDVDGAIGGAPTRLVAVEAEDRLVRHPPQQRELLRRQRRAQRRDRVGKAREGHGDDVDIALDRDHRAPVMGGLAGVVVVVEHVALVEERRLGAVQVLGGDILLQRAAAEGDGRGPARRRSGT